ncbi:MAG: hypothetical protein HQL50_01450 [Magnetococcales bacterium]|nr:hypothetical protein [Magnetococcales bacterium]
MSSSSHKHHLADKQPTPSVSPDVVADRLARVTHHIEQQRVIENTRRRRIRMVVALVLIGLIGGAGYIAKALHTAMAAPDLNLKPGVWWGHSDRRIGKDSAQPLYDAYACLHIGALSETPGRGTLAPSPTCSCGELVRKVYAKASPTLQTQRVRQLCTQPDRPNSVIIYDVRQKHTVHGQGRPLRFKGDRIHAWHEEIPLRRNQFVQNLSQTDGHRVAGHITEASSAKVAYQVLLNGGEGAGKSGWSLKRDEYYNLIALTIQPQELSGGRSTE